MSRADDTIFALATPPGRGAIAVVRLSGPATAAAVTALSGGLPAPRRATLRRLRDAAGEALDEALVLWMPGPASYTGEDAAELHLHGGRAVVAGVVEALAHLPGLRPAEPGEFTRRAFLAGGLDLTAAEAVADLVAAETAAQRRQAYRQMTGGLAGRYGAWRERLSRLVAHLEAAIDFPDEELPAGLLGEVADGAAGLERELTAALADARRGERLREGWRIAIVGPPNAGKSTLLNWLARREAAIVSEEAGTTRDVIEVHLDLGGYPVLLADTAGLREAGGAIEAEGVRRARAWAAEADLRLVVVAGPELAAATPALVGVGGGLAILVANKADLGAPDGAVLAAAAAAISASDALVVSVREGSGLAALVQRIETAVAADLGGEGAIITRARHRRELSACAAGLAACRAGLAAGAPLDQVAEEGRLALRALGRITGAVDVEDLLDIVFRDFCIGK